MWKTLAKMWKDLKLLKLNSMSGDFNFIEDVVDRLLVHKDNRVIVDAFKDF